MFLNKSEIEKAKQFSIVDYLNSKGIQPFNLVGNQLVYFSPLTNEKTPSFLVEPTKNVFNDYSSGQKGDIIRLIQLIEQISFNEAINRLENLKNSVIETYFSFSGKSNLSKESKIEVKSILPITNTSLIQYVEQRGININLGRMYLKEVHFRNNSKNYFAVGFQNSCGYELRNGLGFKGKTANGITVFDKGTLTVNLFEGFFDFLSALQYYNTTVFNNTTVILNTNNNLQLFLTKLLGVKTINSFLDNDKSGIETFNKVSKYGLEVHNQSNIIYPKYKDFNDFLINK